MGNKTYNKLTNIYINKNIDKQQNINDNNKEIFFKNNPNIRFKKKLLESEEYNYKVFEYFFSYIENRHNIAIGTNSFNINILTIVNKDKVNIINKLEGHKAHITEIKYFKNDNLLNEEFLLSAENKYVFIWDINNNYNLIYKIITKYSKKCDILSCLMLFNILNNNYIIISSFFQITIDEENEKDYTKLYEFNNKRYTFKKNFPDSNNNQTCYILSWYNKKNNNYYLIECCKDKIDIFNIITQSKYAELTSPLNEEKKIYYNYGIIYTNKDNYFLCCSLSIGIIGIWNLEHKYLIDFVQLNDCWPGKIVRWDKTYIIVADKHRKSLNVIYLNNLRVISIIILKQKTINCIGYNSIVKLDYPGLGESILALSLDEIELWTSI